MHYLLILLCFALTCPAIAADSELIWPLDTEPALTSSFAEYRSGHFHSGIDLKAWGQIDIPCRAIHNGYVSRVKVSPYGYGKAVYLKLEDGRTAVYAHLHRFEERIENIVLEKQHERQSYALEMYFDKTDSLFYKKNAIVAYSGRTGTRWPHLHFEIRDKAQRPLNVLLEDYTIEDTRPPVPVALALIPMDGYSTIELDNQPRIYKGIRKDNAGVYRIGDPVGITGTVGFSLNVYDKADAAENVLDIYRIVMYLNDSLHFETRLDRFNFGQTSQIRIERDFMLQQRNHGIFHRLYRAAGNELPLHQGEGLIERKADYREPDKVRIHMFDIAGNESRIEMELVSDHLEYESRGVSGDPLISYNESYAESVHPIRLHILNKYIRIIAPPGISGFRLSNHYQYSLMGKQTAGGTAATWIPGSDFDGKLAIHALDHLGAPVLERNVDLYKIVPSRSKSIEYEGKIKLDFPQNSFYDTTWVKISPEDNLRIPGWVESVYRIDPNDQPLNNSASISITLPDTLDTSGWGLYYYSSSKGWIFMSDEVSERQFSSKFLSCEIFGLVRDVDVPRLDIRYPAEGSVLTTANPKIDAVVADTTAGLSDKGLRLYIDGKLMPAQYDPPINRFKYDVWQPLDSGDHVLEIILSDRVGNTTSKSVNFTVKPN